MINNINSRWFVNFAISACYAAHLVLQSSKITEGLKDYKSRGHTISRSTSIRHKYPLSVTSALSNHNSRSLPTFSHVITSHSAMCFAIIDWNSRGLPLLVEPFNARKKIF